MGFHFLCNVCLKYFSFEGKLTTYDHKCNKSSRKVPVILFIFSWLSKNTQMPIVLKICPVVAGFFHEKAQAHRQTDQRTDGRTEMTKLVVAFLNFANAPKIGGVESAPHTPTWHDAPNHTAVLNFSLVTIHTAEWRFLQTVVLLSTEFQWWVPWGYRISGLSPKAANFLSSWMTLIFSKRL